MKESIYNSLDRQVNAVLKIEKNARHIVSSEDMESTIFIEDIIIRECLKRKWVNSSYVDNGIITIDTNIGTIQVRVFMDDSIIEGKIFEN